VKDEDKTKEQLIKELVDLRQRITDLQTCLDQRMQEEEALHRYRQLVKNLHEGIWVIDKDACTTFVNPHMAEMLGCTVEEMQGKHLFSFMDERGVEIAERNLERRKQGIKEEFDFEFLRKDGTQIYASIETAPITDDDGNYIGALAAIADLTERKQAEEQIKASLREKEILLQEIHHRVKNNLQIISTLLYLQSGYIKDKEAFEMFNESINRIKSMALIHEKLYQFTDLGKIDVGEYIRELAADLFLSYGVKTDGIKLETHVHEVLLSINTAIPCGLIINELVSNSLRHAFPDAKKGKILIDLSLDSDYMFTLIVGDNGVGFPKDLDFRNTETLGLQLVMTLVKQLKGTIELDRSGGTAFKITFAEQKYKK